MLCYSLIYFFLSCSDCFCCNPFFIPTFICCLHSNCTGYTVFLFLILCFLYDFYVLILISSVLNMFLSSYSHLFSFSYVLYFLICLTYLQLNVMNYSLFCLHTLCFSFSYLVLIQLCNFHLLSFQFKHVSLLWCCR